MNSENLQRYLPYLIPKAPFIKFAFFFDSIFFGNWKSTICSLCLISSRGTLPTIQFGSDSLAPFPHSSPRSVIPVLLHSDVRGLLSWIERFPPSLRVRNFSSAKRLWQFFFKWMSSSLFWIPRVAACGWIRIIIEGLSGEKDWRVYNYSFKSFSRLLNIWWRQKVNEIF